VARSEGRVDVMKPCQRRNGVVAGREIECVFTLASHGEGGSGILPATWASSRAAWRAARVAAAVAAKGSRGAGMACLRL
jgi:hypothetical protein